MLNTIARGGAIVAVLIAAVLPALGDDDFPIVGTYTKDEVCKGDAARRADILVRITRQNIESSMGSCIILNKRRDGRAISPSWATRPSRSATTMRSTSTIRTTPRRRCCTSALNSGGVG